jgi:hypothetical protein
MLENEAAAPARERAGYELEGNVGTRTVDACSACQHLPFARAVELAVEMLVEEQAAEWAAGLIVLGLRDHLDVERTSCVVGHDGAFLRRDWADAQRNQDGGEHVSHIRSVSIGG